MKCLWFLAPMQLPTLGYQMSIKQTFFQICEADSPMDSDDLIEQRTCRKCCNVLIEQLALLSMRSRKKKARSQLHLALKVR